MADQADVEEALAGQITAALYPDGFGAGLNVGGVSLVDIRRGWPIPAMLDQALASNGDVLVRIYPEPGMTRNTSRFVPEWRELAPVTPTLTASVSGHTVTFGGTGAPTELVGVMLGSPPHATAFAYRLQDGDDPVSVAQVFKHSIGGATDAIGPQLLLFTNLMVTVRILADQPVWLETRRQDQGFRVSVWAANSAARDAVAAAIDQAFANAGLEAGYPTMFLPLADGSVGWLRYRSTYNLDNAEKAGLYRRDLCYLVEYPTTATSDVARLLFPYLTVDPDAPVTGPIPVPSARAITLVS